MYKGEDGLTEQQRIRIMRDCEHLLWTDPTELLPEDRSLLELDFADLGEGPAIARQTWLSEMQAALCAARGVSHSAPDQQQLDAPIDTEGSIRFRRRRRRTRRRLRST